MEGHAKRYGITVVGALVLVVTLGSCSFFAGDLSEETVRTFFTNINDGNYDAIRDQLDPDAQDTAGADAAFWQSKLPNPPYSIEGFSGSNTSASMRLIDGSNTDSSAGFGFTEVGGGLFSQPTLLIRRIDGPPPAGDPNDSEALFQ